MKVIFPKDEQLQVSKGLLGATYRALQIPYAKDNTFLTKASFGTVIVQLHEARDFTIGYQLSYTDRPVDLHICFDKPVLMLSFLLDGRVAYISKGIEGDNAVKSGRFHLCYESEATHPLHLGKGYLENFHIIISEGYLENIESQSEQIRPLLDALKNKSPKPLHTPFYKITVKMRKIIREIISYRNDHVNLFIQGKINELLLLYLHSVATQDFPEPLFSSDLQKLQAVCDHIKDNLDKQLGVAQLAKQFAYSEHTLHKKFTKTFGLSLHRYIIEQRMLHACNLLTGDKYYTVEEIALMCGYQDVSNFSNAFKKRFGHNTGYYRMIRDTVLQDSTTKINTEIHNKPAGS